MKGSSLLWIAGGIVLIYYLSQTSAAAEAGASPPREGGPGLGPPLPPGKRTLRLGMRGEDVKVLQQALVSHRFPVTVDGVFGKLVQGAVLRFQAAKGLKADGIVGPQTWAALGT